MDSSCRESRDGYLIEVFYDADAASPASWCNAGHLAYRTRESSIGSLPSDPYGGGVFTDDCDQCDGGMVDQYEEGVSSVRCSVCDGSGYVTDGEAIARRLHGAIACLPVYAFDGYIGTTLKVIDSWDSANGWIWTDGLCSCGCGGSMVADTSSPDELRRMLQGELEAWQQWAQGEVYGYTVTREETGELVDSCWGFYGEPDAVGGALHEAREAVAWEVAREEQEVAKIARIMAL